MAAMAFLPDGSLAQPLPLWITDWVKVNAKREGESSPIAGWRVTAADRGAARRPGADFAH